MIEHASCSPCRRAVVRTYHELRDLGSDDVAAFEAAVTVLMLRHMERTRQECLDLAADWIADDLETALETASVRR